MLAKLNFAECENKFIHLMTQTRDKLNFKVVLNKDSQLKRLIPMVAQDPYKVERNVSKEIQIVSTKNGGQKSIYMVRKKRHNKLDGKSIEEWKTVS
jgi:hypothetical protein